jgi:acyl carrier protein
LKTPSFARLFHPAYHLDTNPRRIHDVKLKEAGRFCLIFNTIGHVKACVAIVPAGGVFLCLFFSNMAVIMEKLLKELKVKIIELLNLIDVKPEDIREDDQLVGGHLDIDSIDVLEMVIMIEKDYGVKIDSKELGVKAFATLRTLAEFIYGNSRVLSV